jgi:hypothetical protein
MTTIRLTNQSGSLIGPVETRDSQRFDDADDALGTVLADLETLGLLEPIDLARVRAILQKYSSGGLTNALGSTSSTGDAEDSGRRAAAAVARNIAHNQSVARGYADFWSQKNQELRDSIRR